MKAAKLWFCVLLLTAAEMQAQFPRTITDPAAVGRGAEIYAADCARCHGADARGTSAGPDMIRSTVVLHDRREKLLGKELAPYLKSTAPHNFDLSGSQASDLSEFLSAAVNKILRSGYDSTPKDLLSGDAVAGQAYFNGEGGCAKCHSVTGDLAGIGKRYSAPSLQQRFLFPASVVGKKAPITVSIKIPGGTALEGDLVRMDDFTVLFRDKTGITRSINRSPGMEVTTINPYAAHVLLLNTITDADIHNLTTFLDTLQ